MARIKDQNYYVTNGWMINQLGLSGRELQVYAIIYGFTQDGETEFNGSLTYLMEWLNVNSKHTVIKAIDGLIKKGLVAKRQQMTSTGPVNYYITTPISSGAENALGSAKSAPRQCKKCTGDSAESAPGGSAESAPDNYIYKDIDNNNNNNNNKSDDDEKLLGKNPCTPYEHIRKYYNNICHSFPKCISLSDKRKKAIDARWKEYGQDLQVFAKLFTLAEESDFLKGKNDRNWSATFDWLLNQNNMVKVLEGKYRNKGGAGNVGTKPLTTAELEAKLRASGQLKEAPDWMQ